MSDEPLHNGTARASVKLRILDQVVQIDAELPAGQARLDEVLPLLRQIDDRAIEHAVQRSEQSGEPISCCRGCSACCRAQPVPVTPAEAYALWRLVESLPEPQQIEVRARFREHEQRLVDAGLADTFLNRDPGLTPDEARQAARRYFALGLVCPFLSGDGACGIYDERPFVCRQYLVTSPAELCANPLDNPVKVVQLPLSPASAFQKVASQLVGREQFTVPLTLALTYVERHRAELEQTYDARELASRCVEALFAAGSS